MNRDDEAQSPDESATNAVVIGTEMAAARAAEERHQAEWHPPSPLNGIAYDSAKGELDLLHLRDAPAEPIIDAFVDRFAAGTRDARDLLRSSLSMEDLYTLLTYARRAAVRTLRSGHPDSARRAVTALAAIDQTRIDWRDLAWQAALLSYALYRTSGDAAETFRNAASLADEQTAAFLARRGAEAVTALREWGYREIETSTGAGLVATEGARYEPRADLVAMAETLRGRMQGEPWTLSEPTIGVDPARVWLREGSAPTLDNAMRRISGCASLRGHLDEGMEGARAQHMLVFLVETEDSDSASAIAAAAGPGGGTSFAGFGVAVGAVCAVVVARSFVEGTPAYETQASLQRLRPRLSDILATARLV